MRFDQALAAKTQARQVRDPIEFPKFVKVDGKDVLALHAEHEAELLGPPAPSPDEYAGEDTDNLLSVPEKRKPGRPRIIHPEKD
jgi:hypothetical protein